jgi:hypothetical protein
MECGTCGIVGKHVVLVFNLHNPILNHVHARGVSLSSRGSARVKKISNMTW